MAESLPANKVPDSLDGQMAAVVEHLPTGVLVLGADGSRLLLNEAARRIMGVGALDAPQPDASVEDRLRAYDPRDPLTGEPIPPEETAAARALCGQPVRDVEYLFRQPGTGQRRWVRASANPLFDSDGSVAGAVLTFTDVTEERRVQQERDLAFAELDAQRRVLEQIARGSPLDTVLNTLVRLLEEQSARMLCTILLLDDDGRTLRHGAAPSLPDEYVRAIDGAVIGPAVGSCGTAAFRRERVVVRDIASDPLWAEYRHAALRHGLRACWSTPILSVAGDVLGTFAVYYREPGAPDPNDERLVAIATHLAAIAIERHHDERRRSASEQRSAERERLDGALLVARTAAHELNNALSPVLGYAELLKLQPKGPQAVTYASLIAESAAGMAELVARLQSIVRLQETPSALGPDRPVLDLERSTSPEPDPDFPTS